MFVCVLVLGDEEEKGSKGKEFMIFRNYTSQTNFWCVDQNEKSILGAMVLSTAG